MVKSVSILVGLLLTIFRGTAAPALTLSPYESHTDAVSRSQIDDLVFANLERLNLQPAALCSDGVFVRRACLDVIGTLPSAQEAKEFVLDRSAGKRRALI